MVLTTQLSLLMVCNLLLIVAGLVSITGSRKQHRRRWLTALLLSYFGFNLSLFLETAIYGPINYIFYILQFPLVQCLAYATCEYSFSLAEKAGVKRPRYFAPLMALLFLVYMAGLWRAHLIGGDDYGLHFSILLVLPIGTILFNTGFLAVAVSRAAGEPVGRIIAAFRTLAQGEVQNRALLGIFITLLLCFVGAVIVVVLREIAAEKELLLASFFILNTLIIVSFVLTYLNYVEERLDIGTKIAGVLQLVLLTSAAVLFLSFMEEETGLLPQHEQLLESQSLTFSARGENLYEVTFGPSKWDSTEAFLLEADGDAPIIMTLPFGFPFFGETYQRLLLHPSGFVAPLATESGPADLPIVPRQGCFSDFPAMAPFCSGAPEYQIYMHASSNKVVITWEEPSSDQSVLMGGLTQIVVEPDGTITFSYQDFPRLTSALWLNLIGISNGQNETHAPILFEMLPRTFAHDAILFDLSLEKRKVHHGDIWPLMALLVLVSVLLMTIFPRYLKRALTDPLDQLRHGLAQVDQGNLETQLRDHARDEFGDLARGFNRMIRSLDEARHARDEQTELLESELSDRTIEVAKRGDKKILSKDAEFEQKIRDAIEKNMDNFDFQVADLAIELAVSPRQLHRRVVTLTAQTPAALVRTLRLNRAKELLDAQAVNVSEAAYKTGFRDVGYFSKLFTKQFGCSPSDLINRRVSA